MLGDFPDAMSSSTDPIFAPLAAGLAGEYQLERVIGRGGMGVVYLAHDLRLERQVAIKVLPPAADAPGVRDRFLREARTAARLSHPNIVPVYRAAEVGQLAYFVMGFVDGQSVEEMLAEHRTLGADVAVHILHDAARALAHAHARGVVHRDVKPGNILVERNTGLVLLTDFGIAQALAEAHATPLTESGQVLGTVHYMSPEQASGEPVDGRSDLYALGVVGFRILSGRVPFEGSTAAVLVAHVTTRAPNLSSLAPQVPVPVADVIDRCLRKDPAERYATGEDLARALDDAHRKSGDARSDSASIVAKSGKEESGLTEDLPRARTENHLSESAATDVWRRAAELQEAATGRHSAVNPKELSSHDDGSGFAFEHVEQAAVEAGIDRRFVMLAIAESAEHPAWASSSLGRDRMAAWVLGTAKRRVHSSRVIDAPAERVLAAFGSILLDDPFRLSLRDTVGGSPLRGGVLVFDLPKVGVASAASRLAWANLSFGAGARRLLATFAAVPSPSGASAGACEVTLHADVLDGRGRVVAGALFMDAMAGLLGGGVGWMVGFKIAAIGAAMATSMTALGAAGLAAGVIGYHAAFRKALAKAEGEMSDALDAVASSLRSVAAFGPSSESSRARLRKAHGESRRDDDDFIVPIL